MSGRVNWSYLDGVLVVWIDDGPIAHPADPVAATICEALSNLMMQVRDAERPLDDIIREVRAAENARAQAIEYDYEAKCREIVWVESGKASGGTHG